MKALHKRLSGLEMRGGAFRWHRVIQQVGQSFDDALSIYEAGNGPVLASDKVVVRLVVQP